MAKRLEDVGIVYATAGVEGTRRGSITRRRCAMPSRLQSAEAYFEEFVGVGNVFGRDVHGSRGRTCAELMLLEYKYLQSAKIVCERRTAALLLDGSPLLNNNKKAFVLDSVFVVSVYKFINYDVVFNKHIRSPIWDAPIFKTFVQLRVTNPTSLDDTPPSKRDKFGSGADT